MQFQFANAGHPKPIVWRKSGNTVEMPGSQGNAAGVLRDFESADNSIMLSAGDRVFLYTDGFTEARSGKGEELGEEEFARLIGESCGPDLDETLDTLLDRIGLEREGFTISDDMLLIGIEAI